MLNRLMSALNHLLYARDYEIVPGNFEAFLSDVPDLDAIAAPEASGERG